KPRSGSRSSGSVPRNVYRTLDGGWVCLSASTQGMAMRVLRSIGRPELCDDPRFKTNEQNRGSSTSPNWTRSSATSSRPGRSMTT
ncbi:CoA transferase, partial [Xanthomonas citri pv. citri]